MSYRIRNFVLVLCLVSATAFGLAACSDSDGPEAATTSPETVTVTEPETEPATETEPETVPETEPPHVHVEEADAAVAPTCTETGLAEGKHCSDCGEVLVAQEEVPATGHAYAEEWTTDAVYHWHAATCEHTDLVDARAVHAFDENYACTVCAYQATPTEGLAFTQSADGKSYSLTGIGTATDTHIVIPATHEDLPVVSIGDFAFCDNTTLTGVTIPSSVESIGTYAFHDCTALTDLSIPDSVTSIGTWAFHDCTALKEITVGNGVTTIGGSAFYNCTGVASITLGTALESIGDSAFRECVGLTAVTIPESLTSIGHFVFYGCDQLTEINNLSALTVAVDAPINTVEFDETQIHEGVNILYEAAADSPNANICVVVDAGHGHDGTTNSEKEPGDPAFTSLKAKNTVGATGQFTGQLERELNLAVAINLRNELVKRGYTVVMVRETHDVDASNITRAQIANSYKEQYEEVITIHIHANSFSKETAKGALVMCQKEGNPYCGDLYGESLRLSNAIIDPFCKETGMSKRSMLYSDTMTGLNWTDIPTTFIEMGFLSNQADDRLMLTDEFRKNAAIGIADGVDRYFE